MYLFVSFSGGKCFFVKEFVGSYTAGSCIKDTGQVQSNGSWGRLFFLKLFSSCFDPATQFRFLDNGAMLNLKRQGCLAALHRNSSGYDLDMFYLYVDSVSLDTAACAQKPNESIYRAITQTPEGALSVYYKGKDKSSFETWCAQLRYSNELEVNYEIFQYIGLTTRCDISYQRFIFGKFISSKHLLHVCIKTLSVVTKCKKNQFYKVERSV
jgi:hypothetical protein